jgi:hypothetical protein
MKERPDGTDVLPMTFQIIAKKNILIFFSVVICSAKQRTSPRPWCPGCSEKTPSTFAAPLVHSARHVFRWQGCTGSLVLDETEQSTPSGQRSAYDITERTSCTILASRRTGTSSPLHGRRQAANLLNFASGSVERSAGLDRSAVLSVLLRSFLLPQSVTA